MTKQYRPRLIDIRKRRERLDTGKGSWSLTVAEVDGDPVVMNVEQLICDGITVTDNGDGSVNLTATGGAPSKPQIVGGMFGDLVNGAGTWAEKNLKAASITLNCGWASCYPAAPTGDLVITINIGSNPPVTLTISAGNNDSGAVATFGPYTMAQGDNVSATLTMTGGVYTGSIGFMVADGS